MEEEQRASELKILSFLQRQGRLRPEDVARIGALVTESKASVHEILESEGIISEKDLALLLSSSLGLRIIDLSSFALDVQVARELKESLAVRYQLIPIRSNEKTIDVATANPLDLESLKAVEFATSKRVQPFVSTQVDLRDALNHAYRLQESLDQFLQHVPGTDEKISVSEIQDEGDDLRSVAQDAELPPVIKLANLVLLEGIKGKASDIHIEPGTDTVAVRYRIDGVLVESFRFPKWVQTALVTRFKVMSKLDITERRVPQDGRIQLTHQNKVVDLRVSCLPAQDGEKVTIRILDAQGVQALDRIGLSDTDLGKMREALRRPQGMILVTGPTGSGKTTTLYALLRERFSPDINIVSIEDPIEYRLKGINQVQVNEKQGLTFAGALRSILRQDPDVILVGEIRDAETAHIAFQAAQTGHLVLSTVHTNDAAGAVSRLIDLGVEPHAIASGLHLVAAQRLLRRVCRGCGTEYEPELESARLLGLPADHPPLKRGAGCPGCRQTGFIGRIGCYEMLPISPSLVKMIEAGASEPAIRQQARTEGSRSMIEDATDKMLDGVTTAEEILRVVQINENTPRCPGCHKEIETEFAVCPHCSYVLQVTCSGCARPLHKEWTACPHCGGAPAKVASQTAPTDVSDGRTYTALVVDDTPTIRDVVQAALERSDLGLEVVTAENGAEALERAAQVRPDVVVLDIDMPEMDGFEVCRKLRSDVRTAFLPVLMLTGDDSEDSMARGFAVGADDYMTKPVAREALVARVRRMLERTYGSGAIRSSGVETAPSAPRTSSSGEQPAQSVLADVQGAVAGVRDEIDRALAESRAEVAVVRSALEDVRGQVAQGLAGAAGQQGEVEPAIVGEAVEAAMQNALAGIRKDVDESVGGFQRRMEESWAEADRRYAGGSAEIAEIRQMLTEVRTRAERALAESLAATDGVRKSLATVQGEVSGRGSQDGADAAAVRDELTQAVSELRQSLGTVQEQVAQAATSDGGEVSALRAELERSVAELRQTIGAAQAHVAESSSSDDAAVAELRSELARSVGELRQGFDELRQQVVESAATDDGTLAAVRNELAEAVGELRRTLDGARTDAADESAALRHALDTVREQVTQTAVAAAAATAAATDGTAVIVLRDELERSIDELRKGLHTVEEKIEEAAMTEGADVAAVRDELDRAVGELRRMVDGTQADGASETAALHAAVGAMRQEIAAAVGRDDAAVAAVRGELVEAVGELRRSIEGARADTAEGLRAAQEQTQEAAATDGVAVNALRGELEQRIGEFRSLVLAVQGKVEESAADDGAQAAAVREELARAIDGLRTEVERASAQDGAQVAALRGEMERSVGELRQAMGEMRVAVDGALAEGAAEVRRAVAELRAEPASDPAVPGEAPSGGLTVPPALVAPWAYVGSFVPAFAWRPYEELMDTMKRAFGTH